MLRRVERTPLGYDPERGLSDEQVEAKFRSLVDGVIAASEREQLIEWAHGLDGSSRAQDLAEILG